MQKENSQIILCSYLLIIAFNCIPIKSQYLMDTIKQNENDFYQQFSKLNSSNNRFWYKIQDKSVIVNLCAFSSNKTVIYCQNDTLCYQKDKNLEIQCCFQLLYTSQYLFEQNVLSYSFNEKYNNSALYYKQFEYSNLLTGYKFQDKFIHQISIRHDIFKQENLCQQKYRSLPAVFYNKLCINNQDEVYFCQTYTQYNYAIGEQIELDSSGLIQNYSLENSYYIDSFCRGKHKLCKDGYKFNEEYFCLESMSCCGGICCIGECQNVTRKQCTISILGLNFGLVFLIFCCPLIIIQLVFIYFKKKNSECTYASIQKQFCLNKIVFFDIFLILVDQLSDVLSMITLAEYQFVQDSFITDIFVQVYMVIFIVSYSMQTIWIFNYSSKKFFDTRSDILKLIPGIQTIYCVLKFDQEFNEELETMEVITESVPSLMLLIIKTKLQYLEVYYIPTTIIISMVISILSITYSIFKKKYKLIEFPAKIRNCIFYLLISCLHVIFFSFCLYYESDLMTFMLIKDLVCLTLAIIYSIFSHCQFYLCFIAIIGIYFDLNTFVQKQRLKIIDNRLLFGFKVIQSGFWIAIIQFQAKDRSYNFIEICVFILFSFYLAFNILSQAYELYSQEVARRTIHPVQDQNSNVQSN